MPTTTRPAEERQERWQTIVDDPLLGELPYKVETNRRGQIVLSPHSAEHSDRQGDLIALLYERGGEGRARPEFPIVTPMGTKVADVIWVTAQRREEMKATGDPLTLAPEICVEIMSESNDWEEMDEERRFYREAGADEVWVVEPDGSVRVFADDELEHSELAPGFPSSM